MRAGIYARISDDGTRRGLGVERQIEDCIDVAVERGWEIVTPHYVDNNVSAHKLTNRPHLHRLLADVRAGVLDVVLVYHADRISRNQLSDDYRDFVRTLADSTRKVPVVAESHEFRLWTADGKQDFANAITAAEYQSARQSERELKAWAKRRRDGGAILTSPCYGYRRDGDEIQVVPDEAAIVREVYARTFTGEPYAAIARALNERRPWPQAPRKRREWHARDVKAMLTRPRYAGLYGTPPRDVSLREWARTVVTGPSGAWPTIVTVEEFMQGLSIVEARREAWSGYQRERGGTSMRGARGFAARTLLSGFAICGSCGAHQRAHSSTDPAALYGCPGGGDVRHVYRRREELDAFVQDRVLGRLAEPDVLRELREAHTARQDEAGERQGWLRELADQHRLHDENVEDYTRKLVSREAYLSVTATVNARIKQLEAKLTLPDVPDADLGAITAFVDADGDEGVERVWAGLGLAQRRLVLGTIIDSVWCFKDDWAPGRPRGPRAPLTDADTVIVWRDGERPAARHYPKGAGGRPTNNGGRDAGRARQRDRTREAQAEAGLLSA